jgi:hypothetical protein
LVELRYKQETHDIAALESYLGVACWAQNVLNEFCPHQIFSEVGEKQSQVILAITTPPPEHDKVATHVTNRPYAKLHLAGHDQLPKHVEPPFPSNRTGVEVCWEVWMALMVCDEHLGSHLMVAM